MVKRQRERSQSHVSYEKKRTKGKTYGGYRSSLTRGMTLPSKQKVTMLYGEKIALNAGGGLTASHVFSLNGLYDPNITGIGHQPRGFDQIMALYAKYLVIKAKVHAWFIGDATLPKACTIAVKTTATTSTDPENQLEEPLSKTAVVAPATNGPYVKYLTLDIAPCAFAGIAHPMSDNQLKGDDANNPSNQVYLHVMETATSSTGDPGSQNVIIQIEYTAIFHEPKQPVKS